MLACLPWGMDPAAVSSSMIFMIAGVAEPPNFALNFTPFQFQGLWLDVIITPPAAPMLFTANETAGVGTESSASLTGMPASARTSDARNANKRDKKRVSYPTIT